jgi:hypothetical protein
MLGMRSRVGLVGGTGMKIYVVTKGCYSDYHIITATTDKALAYQIKEKFNGGYDKTHVEEYENAEVYLKPCFFLRFDKNGNIIETESRSNCEYNYEEDYCGDEELNDILPMFLSKSEEWKYEKEWRIWSNNISSIYGIPDTYSEICVNIKPKAIYLGENMSQFNRIAICAIAKEMQVPVYKMSTKMTKTKCKLIKQLIQPI